MERKSKDYQKIEKDILKFQADNPERYKEILSLKLKSYRASNSMTQDDMASYLGVGTMQVVRWENMMSMPNTLSCGLLKRKGIFKKEDLNGLV